MKCRKRHKIRHDNHISKGAIWEQLYKSRALEISTLWQRSVFLGAFIILLFTGYGTYFDKMFLSDDNAADKMHWLGIVLGGLIIVFGQLWIAMVQGSKRWVEIYERKIELLERSVMKSDKQFHYVTEEFLYKTELHSGQKVKDGDDLLSDDANKFWLTSKKMSPSKVNIFIGGIIFIIGIAITFIHSLSYILCFEVVVLPCENVSFFCCLFRIFFTFLIIIVLIILSFYIKSLLKHK